MIKPSDFFDLTTLPEYLASIFSDAEFVWDALKNIQPHIKKLIPKGGKILGTVSDQAILVNMDTIFIGKNSYVEAGAYISGPAYIGEECQIRHGAYIRGDVITGSGCVLGHTSEFKNSILLPESNAPHFSYVGDLILGKKVNLGAGTKLSNLGILSEKDDLFQKRPTIKIKIPEISSELLDTELEKFGAILGDNAQTGCNVVTNPGCLIGKNTLIYPNISLAKGYWEANTIVKLRQELLVVEKR